ncbi:hypothetical protein [Kribbella pratensis]|nr:hypothetical protein [Kribbella pratensis]
MHHDDTLSRLQYLSNPLPEPDRTSDGEPGEGPDDETDGVVKANAAATQPEPSSADTPPDVADNAKPTSTDDELEITEAEADEAAQEPTEEPALDAQPVTDRSADSTADRTDDSADLSANRTDDGSDSAEATTPPDRDRDSTTTSDDPTPADDVPAPLKPVTLETEINGETVGRRLERWEPARLNLPRPAPADVTTTEPTVETEHADQRSVDEENAVAYIAVNKETSPWLAPAADCEPAVQSVYASLDQGTGHAHSRHGPALDQQSLVARVTRFEDPAQPDRALRENGVDGLDSGNMHYCGRYATAVADPYVFAAVTAVLSEHPDVQEALRSDWGGPVPARLEIPISDLLGVDGHKYCIGFRLRGDWEEAKAQRKDWALARSSGADSGDVPEPEAEPVQTFEGGDIVVMFKRNLGASKFEIGTFFPDPPES